MTFIFRNRTIFWNIPKWNRGQTNEFIDVHITKEIYSFVKIKYESVKDIQNYILHSKLVINQL